ncbi:hypothetical protein BC629DRAFT_1542807 [Irpex lacteus]|nr:hypothetical protein BC629DRAFT_1542807 [Irpex lacteus]
MALSLPHASSTVARQRRPPSLRISAMRDCTDSVHLALTALMANPNCPLHRLSEEERVWMIKFMTLLWGDKIDTYVDIGFNVSEQTTAMQLRPFHFVFEEAPATDRSASALSVVGMHAYIVYSSDLPANLDALIKHASTQPTIRALVLLFESLDDLQKSMEPFVQVLALTAETIELVLAYEDEEERRAVGVDLTTLEPNGYIWTDLPESDTYDKEHLKSLHILERQLEKKPRLGRLH